MKIHVNGEVHELEHVITAADLVERLALGDRRMAMEINEELLPRSAFGDYRLQPGDRVEIVHAIGGG